MEPTLQIHDVLLVNEFEYRFTKPHEGDIVVFPPPLISSNDFIKRTIGLPGDQIRVHNGVVYRNGVAMNEPYIAEKTELRAPSSRLRRLCRRECTRSEHCEHSGRARRGARPIASPTAST